MTEVDGSKDKSSPRASGRASWPALLAILLPLGLYLSIVASGYDGRTYLRADCGYYLATAASLWQDRDLELSNQLPQPFRLHSGDLALDIRGRLVPKHPIWMPLASMPFVVLLGPPGALLFNLIMLCALLAFLFLIARRYAHPWSSMIAVTLTGTLSLLPHYAYNYSPDVFLSLLLVACVALLVNRPARYSAAATSAARHLGPMIAGLLLGVLITARPTFIVAAVALPLLVTSDRRQAFILMAIGMSLPITCWMLLNNHLFGGPLVTAYDRIAELHRSDIVLRSHRADFSRPLLDGMAGQLLDHEKGLLRTSWITLASLLGLPWLLRRCWRIGLCLGMTSAGLYIVFSKYQLWQASHYGNRFLMPAVVLASVPLACLVDELRRRARPRPQTGHGSQELPDQQESPSSSGGRRPRQTHISYNPYAHRGGLHGTRHLDTPTGT